MSLKPVSLLFFAVFALANLVGAALQISNYSVLPGKLGPGTEGSIVLLLYNSGTSSISSISILSKYSRGLLIQDIPTVNNLDAGATTYVTVPFKVLADTTPGVYGANLAISYSTIYTQLSIPMTVVDEPSFSAEVLNLSREVIRQGDEVTLAVKLKNAGGKAVQTYLSISSAAFALKNAARISLGDVAKNTESTLSLQLLASAQAYGGAQTLPLALEYKDDLGNPYSKTLNVSFNIVKPDVDVYSTNFSPVDYASGDRVSLVVALKNTGNDAKAVAACASSQWFARQCNNIGVIASGTAAATTFSFTIPSGARPATLSLTISGENFDSVQREIPLSPREKLARLVASRVKTTPEHLIQGASASLELRIENYGAGDAKNVRATLVFDSKEFVAVVGKIPSNDRGTANFFISEIKDGGVFNPKLEIFFEDSAGEHLQEETIQLIASAQDAGAVLGPAVIVLAIVLIVAYFYRSKLSMMVFPRRKQ
jgi:hypothetical protein